MKRRANSLLKKNHPERETDRSGGKEREREGEREGERERECVCVCDRSQGRDNQYDE